MFLFINPFRSLVHPLLLLFLLVLVSPFSTRAQGFYTQFGKNRVQYKENIWSFYDSPNFVTYYYQGGQDIANFCTMTAEAVLDEIEDQLEFHNSEKVEIMVYHDLSDARQTNIGQGLESNNTGGVTKIVGNKIFVYFNGDHYDLARQIRQGIASVSLARMIFGTNIQEIIQNAVLLNLPEWFTNGLVAYIGETWSSDLDNQMRDFLAHDKMTRFDKLAGEEATFAGHAFWHYLSSKHGSSAIPNLLYIVRINRNVESGFNYVLGMTTQNAIDECRSYYQTVWEAGNSRPSPDWSHQPLIGSTPPNNYLRRIDADQLRISPDGNWVAYTTNEWGLHKVVLYDKSEQSDKIILKTGFRSYELPYKDNYPLLAWSPDNEKLAIVYEERDAIKLLFYYPKEKKREFSNDITKVQQVTGITFTDDKQHIALTAMQSGQIDLFLYNIPNTKLTRLSNDFYDERQPRYAEIQERKGIFFASNRWDDTLRTERLDSLLHANTYDIFFYDLSLTPTPEQVINGQQLVRFSDTPFANESLPTQYDSLHIAFLGDENGITNQYAAYFDSILVRTDRHVFFRDSLVINPKYELNAYQNLIDSIKIVPIYKTIGTAFALTNLDRSIAEADLAPNAKQIALLHRTGKNVEIRLAELSPLPINKNLDLQQTEFRKTRAAAAPNFMVIPSLKDLGKKTKKVPHIVLPIPQTFPPQQLDSAQLNSNIPTISPINADSIAATKEKANREEHIDINDYFFQSEFDFEENDREIPTTNQQVLGINPQVAAQGAAIGGNTTDNTSVKTTLGFSSAERVFKRSRIRNYFVRFVTDNVVTQLDNSILFTPYQPFTGNGQGFSMPDLNGLIKVGIVDLLEDYRITGGFRIPIGLDGTEYFIEYQAYRKRLDKRITLYRKAASADLYQKNLLHLIQLQLSYPYDIKRSLRFNISYRHDRQIAQATDQNNLHLSDVQKSWLYLKTEYIFDNTLNVALNVLNGSRYKFYAEFHKPFDAEIGDQGIRFAVDNKWVGVIGGDWRHYTRLHNNIVWANRLAFSESFGSQKILYYLGAVENWMQFDPRKRFDSITPIDYKENYAFQALATQMRGFRQNVRNGSAYAVLNSELRLPLFSAFSNAPIRSEFIKNFQLVAFVDVGTTWKGLLPFDEDDNYVTINIPNEPTNTPINLTVRYFKPPIVAGYGFGARTKLLGYFVRGDVAWGFDGGWKKDPCWYISMGLDF